MTKKITTAIAVLLLTVGVLTACSHGDKARKADEDYSRSLLLGYQASQPPPKNKWSQIRQNLIEVQDSQIKTTATTTFFFNQGVTDPILVCPSIGFPIPATSQLTNPDQKVKGHDLTLPQLEPNGIFTGNTSATYAMCIDAKGRPYATYWEGFVQVVAGPAKWDKAAHSVALIGAPSFTYTKGR